MMQVSYERCIKRMEQFEEFVHYDGNMTGYLSHIEFQLIKHYHINYAIYSFTTLICFINFKDKTYCINPYKYSVTTSKQVSYIRRAVKVWERKGFERILWI
jgi:hypothetical protein